MPTPGPTPEPSPGPTPMPTPQPTKTTTTGCPCPPDDPRIESWKCAGDCFACPGRTDLTTGNQVCQENGCTNFYSLTQAQCDVFKDLVLGQTCPGGKGSGLSHYICYGPDGAFKEEGGCNPDGCTVVSPNENWVPLL